MSSRPTASRRLFTLALLVLSTAGIGAATFQPTLAVGIREPKVLPVVPYDEVTPTADADAIAAQVATLPVVPERTHWDDLADCESGTRTNGRPNVGTADWASTVGYFEGGLQFAPPTWDAFRDPDMPERGDLATREQQILVGERVQAAQGWGAWPVCSRMVGLR